MATDLTDASSDTQIPVAPSRLASGVWDAANNREKGEGDICASYSADVIAMTGKIRKPFRYGAHLWTCISISGGEQRQCEAYRLTPHSHFSNEPTNYGEKIRIDGGEAARNDPNGFYHAMIVKYNGASYILTGPSMTFIADSSSLPETIQASHPVQLELF